MRHESVATDIEEVVVVKAVLARGTFCDDILEPHDILEILHKLAPFVQ